MLFYQNSTVCGVLTTSEKGIRDFISHHYFDLDAEIIFGICQNHIDNLLDTLKTIKMDLAK